MANWAGWGAGPAGAGAAGGPSRIFLFLALATATYLVLVQWVKSRLLPRFTGPSPSPAQEPTVRAA